MMSSPVLVDVDFLRLLFFSFLLLRELICYQEIFVVVYIETQERRSTDASLLCCSLVFGAFFSQETESNVNFRSPTPLDSVREAWL